MSEATEEKYKILLAGYEDCIEELKRDISVLKDDLTDMAKYKSFYELTKRSIEDV